MKKYNNPNSANEKKELERSKKVEGYRDRTLDKNVKVSPLGDLEGMKNKLSRSEDHENVGNE